MEVVTKWFFITHIPITLLADAAPLYPNLALFAGPKWLHSFYVRTYRDPLMLGQSNPGGWFQSFLLIELFVQLPACIWVTTQYLRDKQKTKATLLTIFAYSIQVVTTTFACLAELLSFQTLTRTETLSLVGFYLPYLLVPSAMLMYSTGELLRAFTHADAQQAYLAGDRPRGAKSIFITGANSGVGFGCVQRFIDEYAIAMECKDCRLTLVLSVRSKAKQAHLMDQLTAQLKLYGEQLSLKFVYLDLTSMQAIEDAARQLEKDHGPLDAVIFNAGMAQFTELSIPIALRQLVREGFVSCITEPKYKLQACGDLTKDGMAVTFQANFFGHYYLAKRLRDVLKPDGIILWMSSLEATDEVFDYDDPQALRNEKGYESSKRLIDIIWHQAQASKRTQKEYSVHPGFCSTNITSDVLNKMLAVFWPPVFHLMRCLGHQYHVATAYNGAYAPVMIVKNPEMYDPKKKWGSASYRDGTNFVKDTVFSPIANTDDVRDVIESMELLRCEWLKKLES